MPTYEYECQACRHRMEALQPITAKPLRRCPRCGKLRLKRLLGTGGGFLFKGSGFYATDYRSSSYKDAAKKESGGSKPASGETKSSGGGEESCGTCGKTGPDVSPP